jgi:hypothetical protein
MGVTKKNSPTTKNERLRTNLKLEASKIEVSPSLNNDVFSGELSPLPIL